ncbi:MAG: GatB/YqeY domain-containing protein [Candidatus Eremiobacteraeota bacterium]|nr:GatB/YqeY domain-containing protein [Candidatus Eremiobacteraeota bacterium]
MSLKEKIGSDLKDAMKAKDQLRLDTLRSAISAFSYRKIDAGRELEESDQLDVVRKLVKQRTDSIVEYEKAGRTDLVQKERSEREILAAYLPVQKSADDIRPAVRGALEAIPAAERNQGAAMKALMPKLKGEADGATIRQVVLEELAALASS